MRRAPRSVDVAQRARDVYFTDVLRIPKLSRSDEHALAVEACAGDRASLKRLVASVQPAVLRLAFRYHTRTRVPVEELLSAGAAGVLHAVGKFDPARGTRFITYAAPWARLEMSRYAAEECGGGLTGLHRIDSSTFFGFRAAERASAARSDDPLETARMTGEKIKREVSWVLAVRERLGSTDVSMDEAFERDGTRERTRHDVLASPHPTPEREVIVAEEARLHAESVARALTSLNDRERVIVLERAMTDSPVTLQGLADRYGISRERARQIEAEALNKMSAAMRPRWRAAS